MDAIEYKRILAEHGRRVANRVAYAALKTSQPCDWGTFYEMYSSEDRLPESERCKTGVIDKFDPANWHARYANHPASEFSPIYFLMQGASTYWSKELVGARKTWGDWVIDFIYTSLVCGESNEVSDAIADGQGEYVTKEDGCRYCGWFLGWRGWAAWVNSLSDSDISALQRMFDRQFKHRHPEPGTPAAEAWLEAHRDH